MKIKNKTKFKKYVSIIAVCLVMVIAISGAFSLVLSIDNHNAETNNGRDTLTRCQVFGHNWVVENGKPATCQEDGYTTAKYCANCDLVESEKVVLSKLNAHHPVYENGNVACAYCDKNYGANYYYATDFINTEDTFAEGEYVTLEGTVVLKGCSSGGANYYLLVAGYTYGEVVRVAFDSAEAIAPFDEGQHCVITGTVGKIGDTYTISNVDAYYIDVVTVIPQFYRSEALNFHSIESDCRKNREDYFCKLIRVDAPCLTLSSATGTQANSVRFDNGEDVVDSKSEYFTFSLRYLREFTNYVKGSVVTFNDVTVKHKDKAPVEDFNHNYYVYLASWGNSNLEFFILQVEESDWDNG